MKVMTNTARIGRDAQMAVAAGDAFRKHALLFIADIGTDLNTAHAIAVRNMGDFIASATEMCLSIELYFKAIWIRLGCEVPKTHNLLRLYEDIPDDRLKTAILDKYNELNLTEGGKVAGLELALSIKGKGESEFPALTTPIDSSLEGVLTTSADGFVTWRYLYERANPHEIIVFEYPFQRLDLIGSILREIAKK